jgi:APA family basic amino acid/polyamine antiporter
MSEHRSLGFWRTWGIVVGGAIGSAVFIMPAVLAPYGDLGTISLAAATAGAMSVALTMGYMARRVTSSGGPYAYSHAAFGRLPGFLTAWAFWVSCWVSVPAVALGFAAYAGRFVPALASPRASGATALIAVWTTVAINCAGVRESGIVSLVTSVLKLLPIVAISLLGIALLPLEWPAAPATEGAPVMIMASAFALAFWNFIGIEAGAVAGDHVVSPSRTIPRALIAGTATVGGVYLLINIVSLNALAPDVLAASSAPLADVARQFLGEAGALLITAGALVSTAGCLNVSVLETGQIAAAASRDGLFPKAFTRRSSNGSPAWSYVLTGLLGSTLLIFSLSDTLVGAWTFIALMATLAMIVPYAAAALASIAFQRRERKVTVREMSAAVVCLVTCGWIAASSGWEVIGWTAVLLLTGLPVYALMRENVSPAAVPSPPTASV